MKKKIVFGITNLDYGGIELSLVDLVNKLCSRYDITILTLYSGGDLIPKINKKVKVISIYKSRFLSSNSDQRRKIDFKIIISARALYNKYLKNKYDVEVAFMEGPITTLMSIKNDNVKKIAWVHTNVAANQVKGIKKHMKKSQSNRLYQAYDEIIFSGEIIKELFEQYYYVDVDKHVIPNYIDTSRVIRGSFGLCPKEYSKNEKKLVVVTKIEESKKLDRLLLIHKRLIVDGYQHKMYIVGDGPEEKDIEKLVEKLNARDSFVLLGKKDNPYPYIKYADAIILAPSNESYGVSVLEAMILNKMILSTTTSVSRMYDTYPNIVEVKNSEDNIYEGLKYILSSKKDIKKSNFKINNAKTIQDFIKIVG